MDDLTFEWAKELSPSDHVMYRLDMDRRSRTTLMTIDILDAVPDHDRLRQDLERATRVAVPLRRRVVAPIVPVGAPRWVVDPDFDLDYHLRRVRLPQPGTERQLLDLAQTLHATPLDLDRPLWEATVVEGLDTADGGKAALIWKISHSVTDGVGGMVFERMVRSEERDPDRGPMPPRPVPEDLSAPDLTRKVLRRLPVSLARRVVGGAVGALGAVGRAVSDPPAAVQGVASFAGSVRRVAGPSPVEPSPLLRRRSLNRRFEGHDVALADLRAAAKAHGCSVNDAYLASLCGALRIYHEAMGLPVDAVPMAIPVSLRSGDDPVAGNQWSGVRIAAPVGETDPVVRMEKIREVMLTARSEPAISALGGIVSSAMAWMPAQTLAAMGDGGGGVDVQASNIPGNPKPVYEGGGRILRFVPIGPLPGAAMMVVMSSNAGRCFIGVNYDTASVTDHERFAEALRAGFDEVIAVGVATTPSTASTAKTTKTTKARKTSKTTKATTA